MYTVQVTSVGMGYVGADGKTLRVIGRMPIKVGDTVYTDGYIVYGHVPIRQSVKINAQRGCIIFSGLDYSIVNDLGRIYPESRLDDFDKRTNIAQSFNWLYERDNNLYGYIYGNPSDDIGDYLDIYCENSNIFTAEFSVDDVQYAGLDPNPYASLTHQSNQFFISNIDYYHNIKTDTFELNTNEASRLYNNSEIKIKKNGTLINALKLSDFQFAVDKLKELYSSYNVINPSIETYNYEYDASNKDEYGEHNVHIENSNININYIFTQVLSFGFTSSSGDWEMILLSLADGGCAPHTQDIEGIDGGEEVNSYYRFACPVIYYVVRLESDGTTSILHEGIQVKKFPNNDVFKIQWVNAKNVEVKEINIEKRPPFKINFGDCSLVTDLRNIISVNDSKGNNFTTSIPLPSFAKFTISASYDRNEDPFFYVHDIKNGGGSVQDVWYLFNRGWPLGYSSGKSYSSRKNMSIKKIDLAWDATPYIGRLSIYRLRNKQYMICIRKQGVYLGNAGSWNLVNNIPANINVKLTKNLSGIKRIKTIEELIADVTKPKDS
jgi:hypothetical protein